MEELQNSKSGCKEKADKVLQNVQRLITDISKEFKAKESEIGQALAEGTKELQAMQRENNIIMPCPICKKGQLVIKYSKKNRKQFAACDQYPACTATYSLPPNALIKKTDKLSPDGLPILVALRKGRKPWEFVFNPNYKKDNQENNQNNNNQASTSI